MNKDEASYLLKNFLGSDFVIKSVIEEGPHFLFIAHNNDPLEGTLDPFFSVNKSTKEVSDFSPQDYPDPLAIITRLNAAST